MRLKGSAKRRRIEAYARRKVAKAWAKKGSSMGYKLAAVRETYRHTVEGMKNELSDGYNYRLVVFIVCAP